MTYEEFIDGINNKEIKQVDFYINRYAHYNKCSIGRYIEKISGVSKIVDYRITCILTKDHSEDVLSFKLLKKIINCLILARKVNLV